MKKVLLYHVIMTYSTYSLNIYKLTMISKAASKTTINAMLHPSQIQWKWLVSLQQLRFLYSVATMHLPLALAEDEIE